MAEVDAAAPSFVPSCFCVVFVVDAANNSSLVLLVSTVLPQRSGKNFAAKYKQLVLWRSFDDEEEDWYCGRKKKISSNRISAGVH